jgi:hypothetical protein
MTDLLAARWLMAMSRAAAAPRVTLILTFWVLGLGTLCSSPR